MIPLVLVTGFLGSGKTTLLKHMAREGASRRWAFLVNDFSALDVDGEQLRKVTDHVLAIPGGSIFCRCLAGDFVKHLKAIPEQFGSAEAPLEAVIVEASGVSDPRVTRKLLRETGMGDLFEVHRILTVIDPGSFHKLLATLPTIRSQVEAADTVVINKTDVFPQETVDETEARVREINPDADIHRTAYCTVDFDAVTPASKAVGTDGELAPCRDPNYANFEVGADASLSYEAVNAALNEIGDDLYRVKGDILTDRGTLHVEGTVGSLHWNPIRRDTLAENQGLAIIVRGDAADRVRAILDGIKTVHGAAPAPCPPASGRRRLPSR